MAAPLANPVPLTVIVTLPGFTGLGVTDVTTGRGFWRFTVTLALAVGSAWLTAVTVTAVEVGRSAGAGWTPAAGPAPTAELPPASPLTCQVTVRLLVLATLAVRARVAPQRMVLPLGVSVTVTGGPAELRIGIEIPVWELTPPMVATIG